MRERSEPPRRRCTAAPSPRRSGLIGCKPRAVFCHLCCAWRPRSGACDPPRELWLCAEAVAQHASSAPNLAGRPGLGRQSKLSLCSARSLRKELFKPLTLPLCTSSQALIRAQTGVGCCGAGKGAPLQVRQWPILALSDLKTFMRASLTVHARQRV